MSEENLSLRERYLKISKESADNRLTFFEEELFNILDFIDDQLNRINNVMMDADTDDINGLAYLTVQLIQEKTKIIQKFHEREYKKIESDDSGDKGDRDINISELVSK